MELVLGWIFRMLFLALWLLPVVLVAREPNIRPPEKLIWMALTIFMSWLAWLVCMLFAPVLGRNDRNNRST